jgi:hypothetical protein
MYRITGHYPVAVRADRGHWVSNNFVWVLEGLAGGARCGLAVVTMTLP